MSEVLFDFVYPLVYFRSRGTCDTYKQLVADAMNQLRVLHRAGVTSNNQANQLDRLIKAVEQAKSRPIWTPNTTRQHQAELIEQLRRELNKVFTLYNIFILVHGFVIYRDVFTVYCWSSSGDGFDLLSGLLATFVYSI